MKRSGFSMLEIMATLLIAAMVTIAMLRLVNNISEQTMRIDGQLTQLGQIQNCLDKLNEDVVAAAHTKAKIDVTQSTSGGHDTSRLTLTVVSDDEAAKVINRIDWVAAPLPDRDDLILYRRHVSEAKSENATQDYYIPLCENIYSFEVELLSEEGLDDPNAPPAMLQIKTTSYYPGSHNSANLLVANRTFCLRRFEF
jgi:Tfp pilus assembly protein PilV